MKKIVVAITGASGAIYSKVLLDKLVVLHKQYTEISLILTKNAEISWEIELENRDFEKY